jgi:hypothetical protein
MNVKSFTSVFLLVMSISVWSIAAEDDEPFVDGDLWSVSSDEEKTSYILGASDFMTMEYVSQMEYAKPTPTTKQTTVQSFWKGLNGHTMDSVVEVVDAWYENNPDSMDTPVLVVIWNEIVEPNLDD